MEKKAPPRDIDAYIAGCPPEKQPRLREMRMIIQAAAPEATEKISWAMPTYYLNGNLVHFAMGKHHTGFYPSPAGVSAFAERLTDYKTSKGAIQFPDDQPLPKELIEEIVRFRVEQQTHR